MTKTEYSEIENHMLSLMRDSAHDMHHVYRVLYSAIDIAEHCGAVDMDVLLAACLLHDIGREKQFANPALCHAQIGSDMAYEYLLSRGWSPEKARHVKDCISSHRYRSDNLPQTIEAKILFDADKLDVAGAIGLARTFIYKGQVGEPIYILDENDSIVTGAGGADTSSFFQEYNFKLKNIYGSFYTPRAESLAAERQKTAVAFYDALYGEISSIYKNNLLFFWEKEK